ncbi:tigger transposable element-derived protein 1-like [Palaemon carinicauda]|uniref:tigger transposable element-derived protein 1-like n=1 Tax=Palaemon carinicauda TaxID=392227 RepID=UPI0035B60628
MGVTRESSTDPTTEEFKASRGWFEKFRIRIGIHLVVRHGEASSSDTKAAKDFVKKFESIMEVECYVEQQVFNLSSGEEFAFEVLALFGQCTRSPPGLEDDIINEYKFIRVLYLPPNTTPILQTMDQQVISNCKTLYIKHLFKQCFNVTQSTKLTLREFWRNHFNIMHCLKIIDQAWEGLTRQTLNSAWKKLWADVVAPKDFEGFGPENEPVLAVEEDVEEIHGSGGG